MRIRAYATLRDLTGKAVLDREMPGASTVGDVLSVLAAEYPALASKLWDKSGDLTGYVTVLVNGRSIEYLQGAATAVSPNDSVSLFPPVGGG